MTDDVERLEASVHGTVQGVGFRWFVRRQATALGLTGWVANRSDGSVAVVAEGLRERLAALESVLGTGPHGASVERVDARRLAPTGGFARFEIRSGGHLGD